MSVYDRWHKTRPGHADEQCREHSRGRTKLYPSADHGQGDRWQVRWRDYSGRQRKENFAKRSEADARDTAVKASLRAGITLTLMRAGSRSGSTRRNGVRTAFMISPPQRGSRSHSVIMPMPLKERPAGLLSGLPRSATRSYASLQGGLR
jgi:hypothetical protein